MRFWIQLGLVLALAWSLPLAANEKPGDPPPDPPSGKPEEAPITTAEQLRSLAELERLLQLEPEALANLQMTLNRVEKMSEEEKQRLRDSIKRLRSLPAEQREDTVRSLRDLTPRERRLLRAHWKDMTPAEQRQERIRLEQMSSEEREAYWNRILKRSS